MGRPLAGLWLVREVPYPEDCGERIYSANLIESVAAAGADLTVVGLAGEAPPPANSRAARWKVVGGGPRSIIRSLTSTLPLVTARYATRAYRKELRSLMTRQWDFVVLDHYATAWSLPMLDRLLDRFSACARVHVSHNVESQVARDLACQFSGGHLRQLALWLNYLKIQSLEQRIFDKVDLLCAITDEDASAYRAKAPHLPVLTLTPGYHGKTSDRMRIDHLTPRRILMIGSYHWVPKQENLRLFLQVADPVLHAAGVELHVIGSLPPSLREELQAKTKSVKFLGFVEDLAPHLRDARIAVVPELIGGGFKLKSLTYVFGRMPVVTLKEAAAGLPTDIRAHHVEVSRLDELAPAALSIMDDFDALNAMQEAAYDAARDQFEWRLRGQALTQEIRRIQALQQAKHRTRASGH